MSFQHKLGNTQDLLQHLYPGSGHEAGDYSYGAPRVLSWGEGKILKVGKFCSFASEVTIFLGGNHRVDWVTTYPFSGLDPDAAGIPGHPYSDGDVEIGDDVWLGQGCTIMSGVKIGSGACIAACALVTKDVPPYAIVGGNPAKVLRSRFSDAQIQKLLEIGWWDWPIEMIKKHYPLLLSQDIDGFIKAGEMVSVAQT